MAVLRQSLLSLQRRFPRDPDGRSRGSWTPGTRPCRRRRDPCSAWLPSVCRPKTPYASGLRDKPGFLYAGSRRRFLPADQKFSWQTTPCVLAVRPLVLPSFRGRDGKLRYGCSLLAVFHLRITAKIPDQHYFLHLLLLLSISLVLARYEHPLVPPHVMQR